jgi:hypothetical protein
VEASLNITSVILFCRTLCAGPASCWRLLGLSLPSAEVTVGTVGTVGAVGTVGTVGTVGAVGAVGAVGTVGTLGTLGSGRFDTTSYALHPWGMYHLDNLRH